MYAKSGLRYPTDVESAGFEPLLEAFRVSSHADELWYNETVNLWITIYIYIYIYIGWNDKIAMLKKTTLLLYFKTFIEKINSGNLIM